MKKKTAQAPARIRLGTGGLTGQLMIGNPAASQPPPDEFDRAEWAVRGAGRLLERAAAEGRPTDQGQKAFEEAADLLDAWTEAVATFEAATVPTKPISDAVEKAANELQKVLPGIFGRRGDALAFANNLPLIEARLKREKLEQELYRADVNRKLARRAFWAACEKAANLLTTDGTAFQDRALFSMIGAGRYK